MKTKNLNLLIILFLSQSLYARLAYSKTVIPEQFGAVVNDNKDDSDALQQALDSLVSGDTLSLGTGIYHVQKPLMPRVPKQNVFIIGQGTSALGKSILQKMDSFSGQYLLSFRSTFISGIFQLSRLITIRGIEFRGLAKKENTLSMGEEGVFLASTNNTLIENNIFRNFGDSALRITTANDDTRPGIKSSSSRVRYNTFENITQVTTTQASEGTILPGTENIVFEGNIFNDNRSGIKIATRAPISRATIKGNIFNRGCTLEDSKGQRVGKAIEIVSYRKVSVEGNIINGCDEVPISAYPNDKQTVPFIPWGEICIANNTLKNTRYGIRVAPFRVGDPVSEFQSLVISNNQLDSVRQVATSPYNGIIWIVNPHPSSSLRNLRIENNLFSLIPVGAELLRFIEGNPPQSVSFPRGIGHIIQNNTIVSRSRILKSHQVIRRKIGITNICPVY